MVTRDQKHTKLPVVRSIREAFWLVWQNRWQALAIIWLWLLIVIMAKIAVVMLFWQPNQTDLFAWTPHGIGTWSTEVVYLFASCSVAVAWHRIILTNAVPAHRSYLGFDRRIGYYFLISLLIYLFAIAVVVLVDAMSFNLLSTEEATRQPAEISEPQSGQPEEDDSFQQMVWLFMPFAVALLAVAFFVPCALVSYVPVRLLLLLPAIAVRDEVPLIREAWRYTRGNFWRIYLGVYVIVLISLTTAVIAMSALYLGGFSEDKFQHDMIIEVIALVITFPAELLAIGFVSIAYRELVGTTAFQG